MARERRSFTPEKKAEIVAYATKHSVKDAAQVWKIVPTVVRRWQREAGKGAPLRKLRHWTPEKVEAVRTYYSQHGHNATIDHFKISSSMLHKWVGKKRRKANGIGNGLGELPYQDALIWVGRWRQAYFDQLKAETPSAESVLAALRGGK